MINFDSKDLKKCCFYSSKKKRYHGFQKSIKQPSYFQHHNDKKLRILE